MNAELERAVSLYRGPLLEGCEEEWVFQERQAREQAYLQALERLAAAALERGEPEAAECHLRRVVAVDPLRESAQRALMQALAGGGNYAAATQLYRELRLLLHRELNAEPDPETTARYERIRVEAREKAATRARPAPGSASPSALSPSRKPRAASRELAEGILTFLLTDIEGSTKLWVQHPEAMRQALARHDALLIAAIECHGGTVLKQRGEGDSCFAIFHRATDAVAAAVALQRALVLEPWPAEAQLQVRVALHTGEAELREGDYYGLAVHHCARLRAIGHGGQTLLSQTTAALVRDGLRAGMSLHDLGAHRLKDLQRPEPIFQLVHPELPAEFPPLRSLEAFAHNLPLQLTRFIGREREMAAVKRLLQSARLLTLTGAGGCGKTRLALQVAAELLPEYAEGVWFVELAALADPALVPQSVATALGVREEPGRPLTTTLMDHLRPKCLLLVLDNCEHLLGACAQLAEGLLRGCPNLRVLATSREGLGIAGEQTYRVPSLSVPDPKQLPSLEHLQAFEAVSLFTDRASLSQPDFALTQANAVAVAQVCQRLDGIPLAIELAAARVKVLPVETIAERLDDRFHLLTAGSRTVLPRQQTLRALIDWSYNLLSEPERALLRRLSVFAGGWTLEAVEAVGAGDGIEVSEVIDLLTALVEKSLVVYEGREGEARYHLLETVRQYGRDRLLDAGESETVRTRHRDWYLAFAERAEPELVGPAQAEWRGRMETEHDNLRAALDWSAERGGAEAGLRLGGALLLFWQARCHFSEGRQRMARMLALPGSTARTEARAKALYTAGRLATWQDDMKAARSLLQESLAIRRELGDARSVIQSLIGLGARALFQSDLQEAYALFEEARETAENSGDKQDRASSLLHLGAVLRPRGDLQAARSRAQESLVLLEEMGNRWTTANALFVLGLTACDEGDMETARTLLRESLTVSGEVGDQRVTAHALLALARVSWHEKDAETARALLDEALAIGRKLGGKRIIAGSLEGLGQMALVQGDMEEARALFKESLRLSWEVGERLGVVTSLEGLAGLAGAERQPKRVARLFGAAEALRQAIGAPRPPLDGAAYEQLTAAVRAALGEEAFAAAWAAGRTMSLEEALNEALKPAPSLNPRDS